MDDRSVDRLLNRNFDRRARYERVKPLIPNRLKRMFSVSNKSTAVKIGRKFPDDINKCLQIESSAFMAISKLTKKGALTADEQWLVSAFKEIIKKSRIHTRSRRMVFNAVGHHKYVSSLDKHSHKLLFRAHEEVKVQIKVEREMEKVQEQERKKQMREHREKYGPLAGSRAKGRSKHREGSVWTVQGGAPGLGKRK